MLIPASGGGGSDLCAAYRGFCMRVAVGMVYGAEERTQAHRHPHIVGAPDGDAHPRAEYFYELSSLR